MSGDKYNILFLCTGNSARSILAEAILEREGHGRFKAYSAGSQPAGKVNPHALELLTSLNYKTDKFRSKSWNEFAEDDAPKMDFVITVCGNAAGEVCPVWPGHPANAHWGIADPASVTGSDTEIQQAFEEAYTKLNSRIAKFIKLLFESLDNHSLKQELQKIGKGD